MLTPCKWTVFELRPGEAERVAGEVLATTFEAAWQLARAEFGEYVNHVHVSPQAAPAARPSPCIA